jgi:hypothetical protein
MTKERLEAISLPNDQVITRRLLSNGVGFIYVQGKDKRAWVYCQDDPSDPSMFIFSLEYEPKEKKAWMGKLIKEKCFAQLQSPIRSL